MNLHYFQHVPFEGLGQIAEWGRARGHQISGTRFFENGSPPAAEAVDFLVVMGGPMNVYEYRTYPWLRSEKLFLERWIGRGAPVLGVCLGAQLIADVLGGKVYQNAEKEIGWLPVRWRKSPERDVLLGKAPEESIVFHWHGDTFDLPPGATWLAESNGCAHQAFSVRGKAVGLQFHMEVGREEAVAMAENCRNELTGGRFVQGLEQISSPPNSLRECHCLLWGLLDRLFAS